MREFIREIIEDALEDLKIEKADFAVEHPTEQSNGDFASNVAMVFSKQLGKNPKELAESIKSEIEKDLPEQIEKIEIAGLGFLNFYLTNKFFEESIQQVLNQSDEYGDNKSLKGKKIIFEYTDPNPFKAFHIGHVMPNAIGEALSRLAEANGAEVKRVNYQGDIGMHVAKAVWGIKQNFAGLPKDDDKLSEKVNFLGQSYAFGAKQYEEDKQAKEEIEEINKKLFDQSDPALNDIYKKGKQWSLDAFEIMYRTLGTTFDHYFFESDTSEIGKRIVKEGLEKGVFVESDGAIVYKGEDKGLHTRVFLNSKGLPTYEAKELGLAVKKQDTFSFDKSVIVTGNEQKEYMKVVLSALKELYPELGENTEHITHGFMSLSTGKMSSRKGNVVPATTLLRDVSAKVLEKMQDRPVSGEEKSLISLGISVGAIKYTILKQSIGKDITFDFDKSISFEGDSGPYQNQK